MPDILYQWKPTAANLSTGEVRSKPYLIFGKVLRDFAVLPDRISSNVEPWLLQAWFRLDSRIRWEDITDRIEPRARPKWNTMNMDCVRQREDFCMRPWSTSKGVRTEARDEVFEKLLRKAGIDPARNTTRGLTPGLIDPNAGPNSARIPLPERWTKPRPQRKADVDTVLVMKKSRAKLSLKTSSHKPGAKMRKVMEKMEAAPSHSGDKTRALATAKLELGSAHSLEAQRSRNDPALLLHKVESPDERRTHKRKARTMNIAEGHEDRASKPMDMEMASGKQLPEETPQKRKAPRSEETEQTGQERPQKTRKLQSQAAKEFEVRKEAADLESCVYLKTPFAKGCEGYEMQSQTLLPVSKRSRKQHTATRSGALTLSKEKQATDNFDVGSRRAYIGYLQPPAAKLEADTVQMGSTHKDPFGFDRTERHHPSIIQSPVLGTLDFRAYADTETEHPADLSLPSAVMTPRDLGEDMMPSAHSTQSDIFGNCMGDEFEDFLERTLYSAIA